MYADKKDGEALNNLAYRVHQANEKWWYDPGSYVKKDRNVGEMLMLCVSELAEALEGHRKDQMDKHLPNRKMIEVELADTIIRILDIAAGMGLDIGGAFVEKMAYNEVRLDHQWEARNLPGGKKY